MRVPITHHFVAAAAVSLQWKHQEWENEVKMSEKQKEKERDKRGEVGKVEWATKRDEEDEEGER